MTTYKEIKKQSKKRFYSCYKNAFSYSLILFMIVLLCLLICLWQYRLIIILFPFVIIPFVFAYQMCISTLNENALPKIINMFAFVRLYFRRPFFGAYHLISSFLKSFLVFLVGVFLIGGCSYLSFYFLDNSFRQFIDTLISIIKTNGINIDVIKTYLISSNGYIIMRPFLNITFLSSFLFFVLFLSRCILRNSLIVYLTSFMPLNNIALKHIHKGVIDKNLRSFNKALYGSLWLIIIGFILFFLFGSIITALFIYNIIWALIVGLSFASVFLLFVLPYVFIVVEEIFNSLSNEYNSFIVQNVKDSYNQIKNNPNISEEEKKMLLSIIEKIDNDSKDKKN